MLCAKLPGGVLWTVPRDADGIAPQGGVELVHRSPGPFPLLAVQLAPQCRLPDDFRHQLRNHPATLRVTEAVTPEPFAQAHGQGDHFPGVVGRLGEPRRGSIRIEGVVVEGVRVHEDEDLLPGRDGSLEAARDGDSLPGRLHQLQRQARDPAQLVDRAAPVTVSCARAWSGSRAPRSPAVWTPILASLAADAASIAF
jgi:hypothetical protein